MVLALVMSRCPSLPRPPVAVVMAAVLASFTAAHARIAFQNTARLHVAIGAGAGLQAIALADLNRDGRADIVAIDPSNSAVNVFLNDGSGGFFESPSAFPAGAYPVAVATGDVNRDGSLDVVTVDHLPATVTILLGDGKGGLVMGQSVAVDADPTGVIVADLDADGTDDLAVLSTDRVHLLRGAGDGTFADFPTASVRTRSSGAFGIAAGFFDGSGIIDLAISNRDSDNVSLLRGRGDGTFDMAGLQNVGHQPEGIAVAQLNDDTALDFAVIDAGEGPDLNVSLLFGNGDGSFQSDHRTAAAASSVAVVAADIDADGHTDLAVTSAESDGIAILRNAPDAPNSANGFSLEPFIPGLALGRGQAALQAGDLNGDLWPDLVALSSDGQLIGVFLNTTGEPTPTPVPSPAATTPPTATAVANISGSGCAMRSPDSSTGNGAAVLLLSAHLFWRRRRALRGVARANAADPRP